MKKLLIAFAAAGLMVGCAHQDDTHQQGGTSSDSGMMQGQGSGAESLRNMPADQGGTSSQSGTVSGNSSSSSSSTSSDANSSQDINPDVKPNTSNTPADPAIGVTPGAAVK